MKLKLNLKRIVLFLDYLGILACIFYGLLPAEATSYAIDSHLVIPSISLSSDVTRVEVEEGILPTPDTIVGSYSTHESKVFLFGHSSTVFEKLNELRVGDELVYGNKVYQVTSYNVLTKSDIDMAQLLAPAERDSLVLMTCAGENYGNGDSSHRLIIDAILR